MDKLLVVIGATIAAAGIIWWFFGARKTVAVKAEQKGDKQVVEISVDGGYTPKVVELQRGVPAELIFTRKDRSSCFEEVVLPDFGISTHLPINKPYTVSIQPDTFGEFTYACGMNMFFGKVVVK